MSAALAAQASGVAARLAAVRARIAEAAAHAGRPADDVTLVAVSKTFGPDAVREAIAAGVTDLGENRVQEAEEKIPAVGQQGGGGAVRWHLIGHLQSNKVNKALDLFQLIHGIDSPELAAAMGKRAAARGTTAAVLLQVNVAEKETQHGFTVSQLREVARTIAATDGLSLDGLMCIAPLVEHPEAARPAFRELASLHRKLVGVMRDSGHPWRHLSMGMTNDYPVAIQEGATLVRVGRAIFGDRGQQQAESKGERRG